MIPAFSTPISASEPPELRHVVVRDARDRRDDGGRDGVGGVEPSSEADLQHGVVNLRVPKREKRRDRRHLEEREGRAPCP